MCRLVILSKKTLLRRYCFLVVLGAFGFSIPTSVLADDVPPISGYVAWLRADKGVVLDGTGGVSKWVDQSGHGNDFAQTNPSQRPVVVANALGNQAAIRFDGIDDGLWGVATMNLARPSTVVLVYERLQSTTDGNLNSGEILQNSGGDYWQLASSGVYVGNNYVRNDGTGYGQEVVSVITNSATGTRWYVNGQDWTQDGTQTAGAPGRLALGGGNGRQYDPIYCQVSEVIVYDHALSDGERQEVEAYLSTRYSGSFDARVATPTISPASQLVSANTAVSMTVSTAGAELRYTLDGSEPTATSPLYSTALSVPPGTTVRARAFKSGRLSSYVAQSVYTAAASVPVSTGGLLMWLRADEGVTTNEAGAVSRWEDLSGHGNHLLQDTGFQQPTLQASALGNQAAIRFDGIDDGLWGVATMNLARPSTVVLVYERLQSTTDGNLNSGEILQNSGGDYWQLASSGVYVGNNYVRNDGTGYGQEVVSVITNSATGTRWYVNGQDWTQDGTQTAGAPGRLALGGGNGRQYDPIYCQVSEVIVYDHALSDGERQEVETYVSTRYALGSARAVIPSASPTSGTFYGPTDITLFTSTAGATIRFTTDGTDPTANSPAYTSALHLTASITLKARAFAANVNPSSLLTEQYKIQQAPTTPMLWPTGAGGNGHYYRLIYQSSPLTWNQARQAAAGLGGYLATITSAAENNFVFSVISQDLRAWNGNYGPFIGGYQPAGSIEPSGGWQWVNNDGPFIFTAWDVGQPDNAGGEGFLQYWNHRAAWNDIPDNGGGNTYSFVVEFDTAPTSVFSTTVDAGFSPTNNPNGVWSYGYANTLGGAMILYTATQSPNGLAGWYKDLSLGTPGILHNGTTQEISTSTLTLEPGELTLHPGPNNQPCIVRFTAPTAGRYNVSGFFYGRDHVGTTTDVHLLANGASIFDGVVNGYGPGSGPTFDTVVQLSAGGTLDFAVGYGANNDFHYDTTALVATIASSSSVPHLIISPAQNNLTEGGSVSLTIARDAAGTSPLTVGLSTSVPTKLSIPSSATIPANAASVTVPVTAVQNLIPEATHTYLVSATADGYVTAAATVNVFDDDVPTLGLTLSGTQVSETAGQNAVTATVTRSPVTAGPISVEFTSSNTSVATVSSQLVIAASQASVQTPVAVINDLANTGNRTSVLQARVRDLITNAILAQSAPVTLTVTDVFRPTLQMAINPATVTEGQNAVGTVTRSAPLDQALVVALASDQINSVTVPANVTIPAGSASTTFPVKTVNDNVLMPNRTVRVVASAANYLSVSTTLTVIDDDVPDFVLDLSATSVVENASNPAARGAVIRTQAVTGQNMVFLLTSSNPQLIAVPAQVTMPVGQSVATFPITVIDNTTVDGTRNVTITAQETEPVRHQGIPGQLASENLTVYDNEGASLSVSFSGETVVTGRTQTGTVTRAGGASNGALTVQLTSKAPNTVSVPASVVIASGATSANFTMQAAAGLTANQDVTIEANAAGYNPGSRTITVISGDRPDLLVNSITLPATQGITGDTLTVNYTVINDGTASANGSWSDYVYLSATPQPDLSQAVAAVQISGPVATGQGYARSVQVPLPVVSGQYWVVMKTDALNSVLEGSEDNNVLVSPQPITVSPAYTATVSTTVSFGVSGTPIPLQGRAYNPLTNAPAPNVPVAIRILSRGTRRVLTVFTDGSGNFSTVFQPLPTEAGTYVIGADHPSVAADPNQGQFVLIGIGAQPGNLTARLAPGMPLAGTVQIVNYSDRALGSLTATFQTAAPNISAQLSVPSSVDANGQATLSYSLTASSAQFTTAHATIHVVTAGGASVDIPVDLTVLNAASQLVANPGVLERGMVRGTQATYDFQVTNLGATATGPLQVTLPSFPWLSLVSSNPLPSIDPGQTAKVTLLLRPAADLPLSLSTGNIVLQSANVSAAIPFRFTSISEAKGDLRVVVQDDYTFYAAGAPNVSGATVRLRNAYDQSIVVAEGATNANGLVAFTNLAEGPYTLEVLAPQHASYRATTILQPGITNQKTVFIPRQTISYVWSVVPTTIPDQYDIKLLSTFETDVPVPVVTLNLVPNQVPDLKEGETFQCVAKLVNHGLIAAQKVQLQVPGVESGFVFSPLVTNLGDIAAHAELDIPISVTRAGAGRAVNSPAAGPVPFGTGDGGCLSFFVIAIYSYECGKDHVWHQSGDAILIPGAVPCPGGGPPFSPVSTGPPTAPPTNPGTFVPVQVDYSCDPCSGSYPKAILLCLPGFIPGPAGCGYSLATGCYWASYGPGDVGWLSCPASVLGCVPGLGIPAGLAGCLLNVVQAQIDCEKQLNGGRATNTSTVVHHGLTTSSNGVYIDDATFLEHINRLQSQLDYVGYFMGDVEWYKSTADPAKLGAWLQNFANYTAHNSDGAEHISNSERAVLLSQPLPDDVPLAVAKHLIDRYNRSLDYQAQGIYAASQVPAGQSTDFVEYQVLLDKATAAVHANQASIVDGYSDPVADVIDTALTVSQRPIPITQGVCARVRLEIDQRAVVTRKAFLGTLQLDNGSQTDTIANVQVAVDIRDSQGKSANDKFFTQGPTASGFTGTGTQSTITPGTTGQLQYTFIPTTQAAPSAPTIYQVSGTLSFTQNGTPISIPLLASPITVYPDASLKVRYFQQRNVYSDDPFTPQIEPAEPFAIGVMVTNAGAGTANDFSITSAQPQIIDNQKGLLVDFKIIGTQVGPQAVTPSLTVNMGDIAPGQTQVAEFLLTSTLQGKFIEYDASFEHSSALGGAATSLIDSVEIHELIHPVLADRPGDDLVPDFLTNEVADANSLPDTLYLSDGSIAPVNLGTNPVVDAPVSPSHRTIRLTAQMPSGWSYLELPDPGAGYILTQVSRSDGKNILIGPNAWQTNRSFPNTLTGSTTEQLVHLFDYNSTGSYTLVYANAGSGTVTPGPVPQITSAAAIEIIQGQPFSYHITATQTPTSFGAAGLPGGLTFNTSTGEISGTPTQSGRFNLALSATNANGVGTAILALTIDGPAVVGNLITSLPCSITGSGSYKLGSNLNSNATSGNLIAIRASNVMLDFQNHYIAGPVGNSAQTTVGIYAYEQSNLVIQNGIVAYCSTGIAIEGNGSDTTNNVNQRVENMRVTYCYAQGIEIMEAPSSRVMNCQISQIGSATATFAAGVYVYGAGTTVQGCSVSNVNLAPGGSGFCIGLDGGSFARQNQLSVAAQGIDGGLYQDNVAHGCTTAFSGGIDAGGNKSD